MNAERTPAILVVDDDSEHTQALAKVFERAGYRVNTAGDGQEALALLTKQPFDLVITDLRMPGKSGLELLRSFRAACPDLAVVILTAFGEWTTYMEAMDSGAVDYLTKPARREDILAVARKALARRGVIAPQAPSPANVGNGRLGGLIKARPSYSISMLREGDTAPKSLSPETRQEEGRTMLYVVETSKNVEAAARDLEEAVKRNKFGVLHVHDLQKALKEKGVRFPNACKILEVCNPQRANQVLTANMAVNMALPCRISVYQEEGKTKIGMIRPTALLALFPEATKLKAMAEEVERETIRMIDEAK